MPDRFTVGGNLFYSADPRVGDNVFLKKLAGPEAPEASEALPSYEAVKELLPQPVWEGHGDTLACYDKAWKFAFSNLRKADRSAGFVSDFIDTAFNGFLFMWDSSFIVMFGKYGKAAFDFQRTLDNFYSHQHPDGFICREICETEGREQFSRDDPASTGPNILPWAEWEYYQTTGDRTRLNDIFDPLMAYHNWLRLHRSWPDGTYWSCGLACGMDNQPRTPKGCDPASSHGFMSWIDACAQSYLSARILIEIGRLIGREQETGELEAEAQLLKNAVTDTMWSEADAFYCDRLRDGTLSGVKSAGAYWTLLAGLVPEARKDAFIAHLEDPREFKRPCRVPTLSADNPAYRADGGYWLGGVWAPTNYMILKALGGQHTLRCERLAHEIAVNYLDNVVEVFRKTGTLYENYSPETAAPGNPAKPDFVGWTGIAPIAVLFEYVFGIRPEALRRRIVWHVELTEEHGVKKYPFLDGELTLIAKSRKSAEIVPEFILSSSVDAEVEIHAAGKILTRKIGPGKQDPKK